MQRVDYGRADTENRVGEVTGLAWTEVGGDLLTIETACVPGKGKLTYTGSSGEVMQESIQAALTVVRARARNGHQRRFLRETRHPRARAGRGDAERRPERRYRDVHRAGLLPDRQPGTRRCGDDRRDHAARRVLPIGGLKEKLLAAHRGGIKTVLIPYENKRDLEEIPDNVIADLEIHPVQRIDEVLNIALQNPAFGALPVAAK